MLWNGTTGRVCTELRSYQKGHEKIPEGRVSEIKHDIQSAPHHVHNLHLKLVGSQMSEDTRHSTQLIGVLTGPDSNMCELLGTLT